MRKNKKMDYRKYYFKEHKWSILAIVAATIAVIGIVIFSFFYFHNKEVDMNNFKEKDLSKIHAPSSVIFYTGDSFELVDLQTKQTLDTYQIENMEESDIVERTNDFSGFLIYDHSSQSISYVSEGSDTLEPIELVDSLDEQIMAIAGGKDEFVYATSKAIYLYSKGNVTQINSYPNISKMYLKNDVCVSISDSTVYFDAYRKGLSQKMIIGSDVENVQFGEDYLYVFDEYGMKNNFSLIFKVSTADLLVADTFRVGTKDVSVVLSDDSKYPFVFSDNRTFESLKFATDFENMKEVSYPISISNNALYLDDVLYTGKSSFYLFVDGEPYYGISKSCDDFALVFEEDSAVEEPDVEEIEDVEESDVAETDTVEEINESDTSEKTE